MVLPMAQHCLGRAGQRGEIAVGQQSMASRLVTANATVWLVRTFVLVFAPKHQSSALQF